VPADHEASPNHARARRAPYAERRQGPRGGSASAARTHMAIRSRRDETGTGTQPGRQAARRKGHVVGRAIVAVLAPGLSACGSDRTGGAPGGASCLHPGPAGVEREEPDRSVHSSLFPNPNPSSHLDMVPARRCCVALASRRTSATLVASRCRVLVLVPGGVRAGVGAPNPPRRPRTQWCLALRARAVPMQKLRLPASGSACGRERASVEGWCGAPPPRKTSWLAGRAFCPRNGRRDGTAT
jgi:hypothetical protein